MSNLRCYTIKNRSLFICHFFSQLSRSFLILSTLLAGLKGAVGEFVGHTREGPHEKEADRVHNVEEDHLSHQVVGTDLVSLFFTTLLSFSAEKSVVGKDGGNETVDRVQHSKLPDLDQENSAHAGRGEQNDGSDPLNNMEYSQKEEGLVVNFGGCLSVFDLAVVTI
jgi:hypothetical protein